MPPKAKQKDGKKAQEKQKNKVVEDKTFGLKNKNKSKVVQRFVKNVEKNIKDTSAAEKRAAEKKQAKMVRIAQEQELKALFSEALSINVKKSDLKKKKDAASSGGGGGGASKGGGPSDHYDDAWAEAELAKVSKDDTDATALRLDQRIEQQREDMRKKGVKGTPVTAESFAAWKKRKAERLRAENEAALRAEQLKKKGGKGLSVLSGKDLFAIDASLFVDDAEATEDTGYERREEEDHDDDQVRDDGDDDHHDDADPPRPPDEHKESPDEPPDPPAPSAVGNASLYLDGDDDDLDNLDDDDDD